MRRPDSPIWRLWSRGGPFLGPWKAHGRVTVEPDWWLNVSAEAGNYEKTPVRWWQRKDNSQVELEVPFIRTIQIDRNLDTDAATATIVMENQKLAEYGDPLGKIDELGKPGWFTWTRGDSAEGEARWGHEPNEWHNILAPNALLRTYQGYGGHDLSIPAAVVAGNLVLTGVWLIDTISISTDGTITMQCRDMAKLLIEQQLYPPLMPIGQYPLRYCRYQPVTHTAVHGYDTDTGKPPNDAAGAIRRCIPIAASGDNGGHKIANTVDGNPDTYWQSEGKDTRGRVVWIEFDVGETIDSVYIHALDGNYECYISVEENGAWVGLAGTAGVEPYVLRVGLNPSNPGYQRLDRAYMAKKVRLSFRMLTETQWGPDPYFFRAGLREVRMLDATDPTTGHMFVHDMEIHPDGGYWILGSDGGVFTYGPGPSFYGSRGGHVENAEFVGMTSSPTGDGYLLAASDGGVFAFGDAVYRGSLAGPHAPAHLPIVEIERTSDGGGYWLLDSGGQIFTFGNAPYFGNAPAGTNAVDFAPWPDDSGYYILDSDGTVHLLGGDGGNRLDASPEGRNDWVGIAIADPYGYGYWLAAADGTVRAYGNAEIQAENGEFSKIAELNDEIVDIVGIPAEVGATERGYLLVAGDGGVFSFGTAPFFGSMPGDFSYIKDGNYKDYVDIIVDLLLWSGWWLQEDDLGEEPPKVYGNLESTGVFAEDCLPEDLFDKKPVIDAINELKEIVGYHFWIDDEGAVRFELPNFWRAGNFLEDGTYTPNVPEVDERHNLVTYGVGSSDESARSEIIISSENPGAGRFDDSATAVTTRMRPPTAGMLRGMVKPAIWTNGVFTNKDEQRLMAELIGLHIWFSTRQGSSQCVGNPLIQINDQVRIWERQTAETYIHYVRGISSSMDTKTGVYTMNLTTHWLGDLADWAIIKEGYTDDRHVLVSPELIERMIRAGNRAAAVWRTTR